MHLEQSATLRHFSEEEAEAIFVPLRFPILICFSL